MTSSFWIGWIEPEQASNGVRNRRGRIVAPELDETFVSPLDVWSSDEYVAQWKEGLERTVLGASASALVTRLLRGTDGSFGGERWLVYRSGDVAILRDQLVLRDTVPDFDPNDPYKSIRERDAKQTVSEWTVPIELIEQFLLPAA